MTARKDGDLRERLIDWPDCVVPGCRRKCCLRLHSRKCYPHTLGLDEVSAKAIVDGTALLADKECSP